MSSIDILFFAVIIITSLSFFLTIIAFFILASLGSKTNLLEREIEKRSNEFDNFRKESSSNKHSPTAASVIESNEPIISTQETSISNEDTIQIFRNVRGAFASSDPTATDTPPSQPEPTQQALPDLKQPPPDYPVQSASTQFFTEPAYQTAAPELPVTKSYNIPLQPEMAKPQQQLFTLQLYSDVTKDADFQSLWKNITSVLQNNASPHIAVDFSHLNYLYDKEMDYLEKMNYLITNQRGRLSLVNCEQELLALIDRKPHLRTIIGI